MIGNSPREITFASLLLLFRRKTTVNGIRRDLNDAREWNEIVQSPPRSGYGLAE
ncbi:hypothetical protein NPIL_447911, partial [Nephila pilipes]